MSSQDALTFDALRLDIVQSDQQIESKMSNILDNHHYSGAFYTTQALIDLLEPDEPVYLYHRDRTRETFSSLRYMIPGRFSHALSTCRQLGFVSDVISWGSDCIVAETISDIARSAERFPGTQLAMGPLYKSRIDIRDAFYQFDVKTFFAGSEAEILKIMEMTDYVNVSIVLQIAPTPEEEIEKSPLMTAREAIALLPRLQKMGIRTGLSIGSTGRFNSSAELRFGLDRLSHIIEQSQIRPHYLFLGGLPIAPDHRSIGSTLKNALSNIRLRPDTQIIIDIDDLIVKDSFSALFRIIGKKERTLFIQADREIFDNPALGERAIAYGFTKKLRGSRSRFEIMPACSMNVDCSVEIYLPSDIGVDDWIELRQVMLQSEAGIATTSKKPILIEAP